MDGTSFFCYHETMKNEPTNLDVLETILEAMNEFASNVDRRFESVDKRFEGVDKHFENVEKRFDGVDVRIDNMETRFDRMDERFDKVDVRLDHMERVMVTKDYLDEKLSDQRGDLTILMRKEDRKVGALVSELLKRNVLDQEAADRILSLEPFSR